MFVTLLSALVHVVDFEQCMIKYLKVGMLRTPTEIDWGATASLSSAAYAQSWELSYITNLGQLWNSGQCWGCWM